jgi:predicted oxidoreductase (fatty acid repression mutant protein)
MTSELTVLPPAPVAAPPLATDEFLALLASRRSIRRLRGGELSAATLERLRQAVLHTPAAYGLPPWHVVVIHQRREEFWRLVEEAFREGLEAERLPRYLERLEGFRAGAAVVLVYEDREAQPRLRAAWNLPQETATSFVQQALGMVQQSIWLTLTAEGLVTSLQHWDWLLQEPLAAFLRLPRERYRLVATMPLGFAAEEPRPVAALVADRVCSVDYIDLEALAEGAGEQP